MAALIDRHFIKARPWKIWPRLMAYVFFEGRPLTTRGRWINPVVLSGHRLWSVLPVGSKPVHPVFILGTGRSGTTILGKILGVHRDIGYLNEPKALWHAALGDDDLIGSFSLVPGRYRMTSQDASVSKTNKLSRSYRAFLALSMSRRIVDKYPELIFRVGFLDATFDRAYKLILIRNGIDTIQSVENWSLRNGQKTGTRVSDWWGEDRRKWKLLVAELIRDDPFFDGHHSEIEQLQRHVDMAAVEWIVTMRQTRRLLDMATGAVFCVKYEDLVANPKQVLSGILRFCELPDDQKMLAFGETVLKKTTAYDAPDLSPAVAKLFYKTMTDFDYRVAA